MMITIAISDLNQTYCQGLKTMLEQVEGFEVVLLPGSETRPDVLTKSHIDMLLVDEDLYEDCRAMAGGNTEVWPVDKTIVLTMDCNEIALSQGVVEVIGKGAGKREFTQKIRKLSRLESM